MHVHVIQHAHTAATISLDLWVKYFRTASCQYTGAHGWTAGAQPKLKHQGRNHAQPPTYLRCQGRRTTSGQPRLVRNLVRLPVPEAVLVPEVVPVPVCVSVSVSVYVMWVPPHPRLRSYIRTAERREKQWRQ